MQHSQFKPGHLAEGSLDHAVNLTRFTCDVCGLPGLGGKGAKRHQGACDRQHRKAAAAKARTKKLSK